MEKTLEALVVLLDTGNKVKDAIADDGKIDFGEGVAISMKALGLIKVVKNLPEIKEELKVINQEGVGKLVAAFEDEFDIPNDELEAKIEQGVAALGQLAIYIFGIE